MYFCLWLIETWDVLKSSFAKLLLYAKSRLIETWDVLKFEVWRDNYKGFDWLIETWDVLKFLWYGLYKQIHQD